MTTNSNFYKVLFLFSALFNWTVGLLFLFFDRPVRTAINLKPSLDPTSWHIVLSFILVFGLGYYFISQDLEKNSNIIKMGTIGKLAVFVIYLLDFIKGEIPLLAFMMVVPDLIFALLFIKCLLDLSKQSASVPVLQEIKDPR